MWEDGAKVIIITKQDSRRTQNAKMECYNVHAKESRTKEKKAIEKKKARVGEKAVLI